MITKLSTYNLYDIKHLDTLLVVQGTDEDNKKWDYARHLEINYDIPSEYHESVCQLVQDICKSFREVLS